jgi:predicted glycosyltransferase
VSRYVHGLDATAAQTFGNLWNQLQRNGVELVLTHLKRRSMKRLLEAHGIVVDAQLSKGAAPTHAARCYILIFLQT